MAKVPEKTKETDKKEVLQNAKEIIRYRKTIWIIARENNLKSYLDRSYRAIYDLALMKYYYKKLMRIL